MIWRDHPIPQGKPAEIEIGPATLRFIRSGEGVRTKLRTGPDSSDAAWKRWAVGRAAAQAALKLSPACPEHAVVIKPAGQIHLLAGAETRVWCQIHLRVRLELTGFGELTVFPIEKPSETWFGGMQRGELCYWVESHLTRALPEAAPHRIDCALNIFNRSKDNLPLDKFLLRVRHLTLFEHEGRVFSDEVRIAYAGSADGSEVEYTGAPPLEASGARRVSEPAEKPQARSVVRTFSNIIDWMGL